MQLATYFKFEGSFEGAIKEHYTYVSIKRSKDYDKRPNRGKYDIDGNKKYTMKKQLVIYTQMNSRCYKKLCSNGVSTCIALWSGEKQASLQWAQVKLDFGVETGEYKGTKEVTIVNLLDKKIN